MTSVLDSAREGARKLLTRGTDIGTRIEGLQEACTAAQGRLDEQTVAEANATAERAAERLRLSADHTVVAIAGATGSGKSSLFNALTGIELSSVGVKRPTTSWASACVWGTEGAEELLEWLGIPARHQTMRDSMLDSSKADDAMSGVVLLDLPDHDSTEVSHHLEVDRLVQLADLLVWVLDPQKYADAALHDRYLAPMASHAGVMMVVLNQIDTVPEHEREQMVSDVGRLLTADGLGKAPVLPISAKHGTGVADLRSKIIERASAKKAATTRLENDLTDAAQNLVEQGGKAKAVEFSTKRVDEVTDACAEAAGVPTVAEAIERSMTMRARRATGWPLISWFSKLKPDPLKRLHLNLDDEGARMVNAARTSIPQATAPQRARVDSAVRELADDTATGLGRPWAASIRAASVSHSDDLTDRLDRVIGETDLNVASVPGWAKAVQTLQWILITAAIVGLLWLTGIAVLGYLGLPEVASPEVGIVPIPTLLLLGGVVGGLLLAFICRFLVRATARRRAASADARMREGVGQAVEELVATPIRAELQTYQTYRQGLEKVL